MKNKVHYVTGAKTAGVGDSIIVLLMRPQTNCSFEIMVLYPGGDSLSDN